MLDPSSPLVGVTTDIAESPNGPRAFAYMGYVEAIRRAGGTPVLCPPDEAGVGTVVERLDAFVLTGGDDPRTEPFGAPTDPRITPVHPARQAFETALLTALATDRPDKPVLGVCLGMQMMALVDGGRLAQHMPETHPTHADHWECEHPVFAQGDCPGCELSGVVRSKHRQAVDDPGRLGVAARASDGVIEAVFDPARTFFLGVQWHPERTADARVGDNLFESLIRSCRTPV